MNYLVVAAGGALGAIARFVVSLWATERLGATFPYGTFTVNVIGSFILGFFLTFSTERAAMPPELRAFLAVGFVGGFTTFSTFSWESTQLLLNGAVWHGALNILGSVATALVAVLAGIVLARAI